MLSYTQISVLSNNNISIHKITIHNFIFLILVKIRTEKIKVITEQAITAKGSLNRPAKKPIIKEPRGINPKEVKE